MDISVSIASIEGSNAYLREKFMGGAWTAMLLSSQDPSNEGARRAFGVEPSDGSAWVLDDVKRAKATRRSRVIVAAFYTQISPPNNVSEALWQFGSEAILAGFKASLDYEAVRRRRATESANSTGAQSGASNGSTQNTAQSGPSENPPTDHESDP